MAANVAVSQAAVLFDVAFAASLAHHARVLTLTRSMWVMGDAFGIFLVTAIPTVCQWWGISLFLCRFDPGDLVNELILVVYMILTVGQSLAIQDCATCLLSRNGNEPCNLHPPASYFPPHSCSYSGDPTESAAHWPELPFQCWFYGLLTVCQRAAHLLNSLRAVWDIQKEGKRDAQLYVLELVACITLWIGAVAQRRGLTAMAVLASLAACLELSCILAEPARRLYAWLERRGALSESLKLIPIDIPYAEKRWHRLIMIALALLQTFDWGADLIGNAGRFRVVARLSFMIVSCAAAYLIKCFYFDVVDDSELVEFLHKGGLHRARHALGGHATGEANRWRGCVWIGTHVLLIVAICAEGVAVNRLLLPWDGYPAQDLHSILHARYLIAAPLAAILWILCIQQSMHTGTGHGLRAIGRGRRLILRAMTGFAILLLPLLAFSGVNADGISLDHLPVEDGCSLSLPREAAEGDEPDFPEWAKFPHPSSRMVFLFLLALFLLVQLLVEVFGRTVYTTDATPSRRSTLLSLRSLRSNRLPNVAQAQVSGNHPEALEGSNRSSVTNSTAVGSNSDRSSVCTCGSPGSAPSSGRCTVGSVNEAAISRGSRGSSGRPTGAASSSCEGVD